MKALSATHYKQISGTISSDDDDGDFVSVSFKGKDPMRKKVTSESRVIVELEERVRKVEEFIKDWKKFEEEKQELKRELEFSQENGKSLEKELSAKRQKLSNGQSDHFFYPGEYQMSNLQNS